MNPHWVHLAQWSVDRLVYFLPATPEVHEEKRASLGFAKVCSTAHPNGTQSRCRHLYCLVTTARAFQSTSAPLCSIYSPACHAYINFNRLLALVFNIVLHSCCT